MEALLRQKIGSMILQESLKFNELGSHSLLVGEAYHTTFFMLVTQRFGSTLMERIHKTDHDLSDVYGWCEDTGAYDWLDRDIVGMVQIKEMSGDSYDSWMVARAAARSGWGPTMYDLVMGLSPNGMMADRDDVSDQAFNVYKYYLNNRDDVSKKPLDVRNFTPEKFDDGDFGSRGDYIPLSSSEMRTISREESLKDPLTWVYNRPEVPVTQDLLERGEREIKDLVVPDLWDETQYGLFVAVCAGKYFQYRII